MTNKEATTTENTAAVAEQGATVAPEKPSSQKGATQKKGAPKGQKTAKGKPAAPKKDAKATEHRPISNSGSLISAANNSNVDTIARGAVRQLSANPVVLGGTRRGFGMAKRSAYDAVEHTSKRPRGFLAWPKNVQRP